MRYREATVEPPKTRAGRAKEARVLLEGRCCGECHFQQGETSAFDVPFCVHSKMLDSNRWRSERWPACWLFKERKRA